ncbi:MAG TPA: hypothetical protein VFD57_04320 [Clostridia bacterium]|nr:hypothetical protein [Clostridia bacterium]
MNYIMLILPLCVSAYLLSFAKYNWDRRNKMAAIGAALIAVAAIVMPFFIL